MNNIVKLLSKATFLFINIFVVIISIFKHRDKNKVVIGAWDGYRYADNSRYLYEFLCDNNLCDVTWATKSEEIYQNLKNSGKKVVLMGTKESFKVHIESYYHIVCTAYADISGELSWGACKVNLWHGMPIKLVAELANKGGYKQRTAIHDLLLFKSIKKLSVFNPGGWNKCFYLSPGVIGDRALMEDFKIDDKWIIRANYPRNNVKRCVKEEERIKEVIRKHKISIIYLPTFRENGKDFVSELCLNPDIQELLKNNDALWIDKGHYASTSAINSANSNSETNIIHLPATFDICSIMNVVDIVITDYSSVYYDALYNMKRVILYMPDYEYYKTRDRGFLTDPKELKACLKAYNIEEIKSKLSNSLNGMTEEEINEIDNARRENWSFANEGIEDVWKKIVIRGQKADKLTSQLGGKNSKN